MSSDHHNGTADTEIVARILGAVGHLMSDFHARDLAVQNAVAELTRQSTAAGIDIMNLQHIDLVTQTHADLATFLPRLAQCLREGDVTTGSLAGTLTLRSLQDVLLGSDQQVSAHLSPDDAQAGDLMLF